MPSPVTKKRKPAKKPCNCHDNDNDAPVITSPFYSANGSGNGANLSFRLSQLERMEQDRRIDEMLTRERKHAADKMVTTFLYGMAVGIWTCVFIVKWQKNKLGIGSISPR